MHAIRQNTDTIYMFYGTQDEEKLNKKHNTLCDGHHYTQTNTNNVNKT